MWSVVWWMTLASVFCGSVAPTTSVAASTVRVALAHDFVVVLVSAVFDALFLWYYVQGGVDLRLTTARLLPTVKSVRSRAPVEPVARCVCQHLLARASRTTLGDLALSLLMCRFRSLRSCVAIDDRQCGG